MFASRLIVYVRIRRHWLSVRVLSHGGEPIQVEGMARAALRQTAGSKGEVVAIGAETTSLSASKEVVFYDAFCHPRVLIGGFDAAEIVVREFLRRAGGNGKLWHKSHMVIHPQDNLNGGLTDIEERAFQELGLSLGAGEVVIHQGTAELTDSELAAMR